MATTRLSDVIVPQIYQPYMSVRDAALTAVWESGLVIENPVLTAAANTAGGLVQIPFWRDLDRSDRPNISSDNPADKSVPAKITAGKQVGMVAYLNKSWSTMDLVSELAGSDPMTDIQAKTNRYWAYQWQDRLIGSCLGIYYDNVASNGGDMVYDIALSGVGTPGDANKFGGVAAIRAEATLGDAFGSISALAVHSVIHTRMREQNLIQYIQPSIGGLPIATYNGKPIIVDDGMPVEVVSGNPVYTSIFFGRGAFGYGEGAPPTPVAVHRDETAGMGSGEEVLTERRSWLLHPMGFAFNPQAVSGKSATTDELKLANAWERVVERKLVPMAFLRTNG
jgi:hypothetical protein